MTVRLRASVIPGLLALTALWLTACASQGAIAAGGAEGSVPGTAGSSSPATGSSAPSSGVPSSGGTDSSAPASSPDTGSSAGTPTSEDPSALASSLKTLDSLWTDQGCKTALAGFSDYLYAQQASPAQGTAAIPGAVQKIRTGAQQTKRPQAAQAMNKMASDMLAMASQAQQGKTPDKGPVKNDFQIMGTVCSQ